MAEFQNACPSLSPKKFQRSFLLFHQKQKSFFRRIGSGKFGLPARRNENAALKFSVQTKY